MSGPRHAWRKLAESRGSRRDGAGWPSIEEASLCTACGCVRIKVVDGGRYGFMYTRKAKVYSEAPVCMPVPSPVDEGDDIIQGYSPVHKSNRE